jgi:hypothetical protein
MDHSPCICTEIAGSWGPLGTVDPDCSSCAGTGKPGAGRKGGTLTLEEARASHRRSTKARRGLEFGFEPDTPIEDAKQANRKIGFYLFRSLRFECPGFTTGRRT